MHRYSLRKTAARSDVTDEAPRLQAEGNPESSLSPSVSEAELGLDDPGAGSTPTRAARSYRDVAAFEGKAHVPRRRRDEAVRFDSAPPHEVSPSVSTDDESKKAIQNVYEANTPSFPGEYREETEDSQAKKPEWQTVKTRRNKAAALPSISTCATDLEYERQLKAIKLANRGLTTEQRNTIRKRKKAEKSTTDVETDESPGEDAVQAKGKTVDPRNWGSVALGDQEADIEAQRKELDRWKRRQKQRTAETALTTPSEATSTPKATTSKQSTSARLTQSSKNPIEGMIDSALKAKSRRPRVTSSRKLEPVQQIAPGSYLGRVLHGRRIPSGNPDSESSSSDSSTSSSDPDSSDSDDSGTIRPRLLPRLWDAPEAGNGMGVEKRKNKEGRLDAETRRRIQNAVAEKRSGRRGEYEQIAEEDFIERSTHHRPQHPIAPISNRSSKKAKSSDQGTSASTHPGTFPTTAESSTITTSSPGPILAAIPHGTAAVDPFEDNDDFVVLDDPFPDPSPNEAPGVAPQAQRNPVDDDELARVLGFDLGDIAMDETMGIEAESQD